MLFISLTSINIDMVDSESLVSSFLLSLSVFYCAVNLV